METYKYGRIYTRTRYREHIIRLALSIYMHISELNDYIMYACVYDVLS